MNPEDLGEPEQPRRQAESSNREVESSRRKARLATTRDVAAYLSAPVEASFSDAYKYIDRLEQTVERLAPERASLTPTARSLLELRGVTKRGQADLLYRLVTRRGLENCDLSGIEKLVLDLLHVASPSATVVERARPARRPLKHLFGSEAIANQMLEQCAAALVLDQLDVKGAPPFDARDIDLDGLSRDTMEETAIRGVVARLFGEKARQLSVRPVRDRREVEEKVTAINIAVVQTVLRPYRRVRAEERTHEHPVKTDKAPQDENVVTLDETLKLLETVLEQLDRALPEPIARSSADPEFCAYVHAFIRDTQRASTNRKIDQYRRRTRANRRESLMPPSASVNEFGFGEGQPSLDIVAASDTQLRDAEAISEYARVENRESVDRLVSSVSVSDPVDQHVVQLLCFLNRVNRMGTTIDDWIATYLEWLPSGDTVGMAVDRLEWALFMLIDPTKVGATAELAAISNAVRKRKQRFWEERANRTMLRYLVICVTVGSAGPPEALRKIEMQLKNQVEDFDEGAGQ